MAQDGDGAASASATPGRPSWRQITTIGASIGAVITLLVAVGTWVQPDLRGWVCETTEYRALGCNDVPDAFIGEWTGTEICHDNVIPKCVQREIPLSLTIGRGQLGRGTVVVSRSDTCESFWELVHAEERVLEFETRRSRPVPGTDLGQGQVCPTGLSVTLRLDPGGDVLRPESRTGPGGPLSIPGLVLFTAELRKR
ncbi:hypothetical protein OG792_22145 [Micromonospora sp. NBC_01699]|uniref:hypothetical protein n=1 Tax=Micromonospora sp. NBC_01699 TaxID=2975984 RepID=UPI002E28AD54|nr:hypothetical protein [Micromonospora sp. NBC_01699]